MRSVSIRLLGVALVALLLVTVTGASSHAEGLFDYSEGDRSISDADDALSSNLSRYETSSKYYRMHANVRLGREHRLGNGVAWRLLTDVRTGAAAPRITWMADRKSLLKANALFEAIHGEALVEYEWLDVQRRLDELYDWADGQPPYFVIQPPYFYPEKVAVTYATSRLVSYVEVRREVRTNSMGVKVYGQVLDLEQGRVREIEGCSSSHYTSSNFRFGELLDVCEDEAYENFMTLWADRVRQAITKAQASGDELSEQCGESMGSLELDSRRMALYLTPAGVAVFNNYWIPNSAKYCAFYDDITVNPIILPYRELEPFMKPGPWRDELLKQGGTTSR
jgi:hypothetical protein